MSKSEPQFFSLFTKWLIESQSAPQRSQSKIIQPLSFSRFTALSRFGRIFWKTLWKAFTESFSLWGTAIRIIITKKKTVDTSLVFIVVLMCVACACFLVDVVPHERTSAKSRYANVMFLFVSSSLLSPNSDFSFYFPTCLHLARPSVPPPPPPPPRCLSLTQEVISMPS